MNWTTQKRTVKELIPLKFNPRKLTKKTRQDLEKSLTKFNLVEIPAINLDNTILAGHQRLKILIALGCGEQQIDVRVPDRLLTEEEVKHYNILSNKLTAEWDIDLLKENFDLNELLGWGFDQTDFKDLGLAIPDFKPVSIDEQSILDSKDPITCPNCKHTWTP